MKKISRKERERQRHSEEILQAAEAVFAEKGYGKARMSDIAQSAEFSVGYLYSMWKSKKELYLSILDSKIKDFKSFVLSRVEEIDDPFDKINVLIDAHFSFVEKHQDFFKIYLNETSQADMRIKSDVGRRFRRDRDDYMRIAEKIFENGIDKGVFLAVSPHDLTITLKGLIFAFTMDYLNRSPDEDINCRGDVMKRIFFNAILDRTQKDKKELKAT